MSRTHSALARAAALGLFALGCSLGEGSGWVQSDRLSIQDCWDGPFDLRPDFFAANAFREEFLQIRIQRGDNIEEFSDGVGVLVNNLQELRGRLGEAIEVGVPAGVIPPGAPQLGNPNPDVSLSVFLHNSCHAQSAAIYSLSGQIVFESLFSGDVNEGNADDRLTEASFTAVFGDPRATAEATAGEMPATSVVSGYFRFFFQRGQPAQPFP